ncbi:MAG: DedA family protein [Bacteroidales bacterium]|jgi:membrane protein YqaA with SNARE-associated domain|nr:DedA family protein [Bacteroidales bacterium]
MEWLQGLGLLGLFLGTFMAATMVPFNSTVLYIGILLTGVNPWIVFLVGTLGNWSGGLTTYGVGRIGKWEWIEKWFKVKPETLTAQKEKIDRWGALLALVTWLPFVGDVFAIALGFYRVAFWKCSLFMLIGRGLRFLLWTLLFIKYGEAVVNYIF